MPSTLDPSLQVPQLVRRSRAAVHILQEKPAVPFPNPAHTVGDSVAVWQGIKQGELLRALEPIEEAAVLAFRCGGLGCGWVAWARPWVWQPSLRPGWSLLCLPRLRRGRMPGLVGGFDDASANAEFDGLWAAFERDANWCCTTWGDADEEYRNIPLARSVPFAGGRRVQPFWGGQGRASGLPCMDCCPGRGGSSVNQP